MCGWVVMAADVNILLFWSFFGLFIPLTGGKMESGDNVILGMCTNYYDHCIFVWVVL